MVQQKVIDNIEFTQKTEGVLNDVYGYNVDYSGIGYAGIYTVTDGTGGSISHSSPGDLARKSSNLQVNTEGTDNIRPLVVVSVQSSVNFFR